ncbi:hypothetical protein [Hyalangium versicolor]|uniref:hypothetical protein n=1 Tax=Hyalangium versicolor TaxID=2861190 RepID=UPI001CCB1634|nr:hypothetical protein [Hyalangium versicolor]
MPPVHRLLLSASLVLASLLTACDGDPPAQELTCEQVDCGPGTCEQAEAAAVCICPTEYVSTGHNCRSTDPGATHEEATFLEPSSGNEVLSDKADVDVFAIHVLAGRMYRFRCLVRAPSVYEPICPVRLTSESGEVLPISYWRGVVGYEATTTGTVYAEVRNIPYFDHTPFPIPYDYTLEDVGPDQHGDTPETATFISPSTEGDAGLEIPGDVDTFAFDAQAGHVYRFSSGQFSIRLRGPNGEVLKEEARVLVREFTQSGRYTLETYAIQDRFNDGVGPYRYKLEDLGLGDQLPKP